MSVLLDDEHETLVAEIVAQVGRSRGRAVKTVVAAVLASGSIAGGSFALKSDPPRLDGVTVEAMIAEHKEVGPHPGAVDLAADVADDIADLSSELDRVRSVQGYQIEFAAWQGDVLQHVAERRRGTPPKKPDRLRRMELELLRK